MSRIAVVFFSGYGHTARVADAVRLGIERAGGEAIVCRIPDGGELSEDAWRSLDDVDAIIYGSPTYMGGPAWQFKRFAEASSRRWYERSWLDKLAAGFTVSAAVNGDKYSTIQYFWTLAQQHGQIWVGTGLTPSNAKAHGPDDLNWSGGSGGVHAIAPADASPDEAPRKGDLDAAEHLGARLVVVARRFIPR